MGSIPRFIVYDIMSFIPKFNVTPTTLENYKLYKRLKKIIKNSMNLSNDEIIEIIKDLKEYDFSTTNFYHFQNNYLHLTMYNVKNHPKDSDYILIFH